MARHLLSALVAAAVAVSAGAAAHAAEIRIGASAPKTGPLAGGAAVTHWPNVRLWVEQVNARGGLKLKSGPAKIKLIEYDDRTNPGEAIKAIQRLATQDEVDFIVAPFGTGFNLATAPVFARYGYPQLAVSAITDKIEVLTERYPNIFFMLGSTTAFAEAVADVLSEMRAKGEIGSRVSMVNVADAFGIELANSARPIFEKAGFEIVYDTSYPLGTQDLSPVVKAAKAAKPDAFVAWSYPPDTFALTEQAKIAGLDVKVFYTAVATCFPAYAAKFGKSIEGNIGAGGINPDTPEMKAYIAAHRKITGKAPDYWASAVTYASLQVLEQAIEGVGSTDREAVIAYIKENGFRTVVGEVRFDNQNERRFWTVGQWQDGVFHGVRSTGRPGAKPVRVKRGW